MNRRSFFARMFGLGVAAKIGVPSVKTAAPPMVVTTEPYDAELVWRVPTTAPSYFAYLTAGQDLQRGDWVAMSGDGRAVRGSGMYCVGIATHAAGKDGEVCVSSLRGLTHDEYCLVDAHSERQVRKFLDYDGSCDPVHESIARLPRATQEDISSLRAHLPSLQRSPRAQYLRLA